MIGTSRYSPRRDASSKLSTRSRLSRLPGLPRSESGEGLRLRGHPEEGPGQAFGSDECYPSLPHHQVPGVARDGNDS
ncbi:hypothetical protein MLD38_029500 [Melastoma candidum]|uniref:Uncharacterized protein n=1 Tax=Melastoma candidum TaxID=119954 RepID=A0ACB9N460_9MYRT|nr:hypothetical protein MLD38_029500 [Melastoma candidum]